MNSTNVDELYYSYTRQPFPAIILATLEKSKIISLRAGKAPHRFIGVWHVVVKGRVFVCPWNSRATTLEFLPM